MQQRLPESQTKVKLPLSLRTLAWRLLALGAVLLLLAILLRYFAGFDEFVAEIVLSVATIALGFGVALLFVDPIARQALDQAEQEHWAGASNKIRASLQASAKTTASQGVLFLYGGLEVLGQLPLESPDAKNILYYKTQSDPVVFVEVANEMIESFEKELNKNELQPAELSEWYTLERVQPILKTARQLQASLDLLSSTPSTSPKLFEAKSRLSEGLNWFENAENLQSLKNSPVSTEHAHSLQALSVVKGLKEIVAVSLDLYVSLSVQSSTV
ncbi:MAG TPA: hypothetical protein VF168_12370 [Trueperaceae bacterium]